MKAAYYSTFNGEIEIRQVKDPVVSEKDAIILFYEMKEAENKTVSDYMTHPAVYFEEDEPLIEVCDFLVKNIFRRVPITSNKKLVGIISIEEVLRSVLQARVHTLGVN